MSDGWARAVSEAHMNLRASAAAKLPWERGFAAAVFGKQTAMPSAALDALRLRPPPAAPAPAAPVEVATPWDDMGLTSKAANEMRAAWPVAAHRVSTLDWDQHENSRRQAALSRWMLILCEKIGASGVGRRMLVRDHLSLQSQEMVASSARHLC